MSRRSRIDYRVFFAPAGLLGVQNCIRFTHEGKIALVGVVDAITPGALTFDACDAAASRIELLIKAFKLGRNKCFDPRFAVPTYLIGKKRFDYLPAQDATNTVDIPERDSRISPDLSRRGRRNKKRAKWGYTPSRKVAGKLLPRR